MKKALFVVLLIFAGLVFIGLYADESYPVIVMAYVFVFVYMLLRTFFSSINLYSKISHSFVYLMIVILQNAFLATSAIAGHETRFAKTVYGLINIAVILIPFVVTRMFFFKGNPHFYVPSLSELTLISYTQLKNDRELILSAISEMQKAGKNLSRKNLYEVFRDLPRHNSFEYINNGTLTGRYFAKVSETLSDGYMYLAVSATGSALSEIISVFTQKRYNHASLSFDRELETVISYNGGQNVYPPGLNREMIKSFNRKTGASVIVYKLKADFKQKKIIMDLIRQINSEGSAYNVLGLFVKYSYKPNIMYCSQFVYKMLKKAGLSYFEKKEMNIIPTDFIEMDYYRKLEFDYEIKLK